MALAWLLLLAALSPLLGRPIRETHQYCIVGAGPAGIQLGHFLHHAGRDYVIFERNPRAGSFFEKFPRHRRLISLNKRNVREGHSKDFALRHDWNSLLDVRPDAEQTRPMTQRSKDLFPHADTLAAYLAEFAEEQIGSIRYNTQISNIRRSKAGGFLLDLPIIEGMDPQSVKCHEVIVATGLGSPVQASETVDGAEHVIGYEDLPETGESFEGKAVLVLGAGNAGLETAQELIGYTSELHLFGRTKSRTKKDGELVRFAHQTHYVGDLRAGRLTLLDTYLLKSLDTFDFDALDGTPKLLILRCLGNRLCVWSIDKDECEDDQRCEKEFDRGQGLNFHLPMADWAKGSPIGKQVRTLLERYAPEKASPTSPPQWHISEAATRSEIEEDLTLSEEDLKRRRSKGIAESDYAGQFHQLTVSATLLRKHPDLLDALVRIRADSSTDNLRYPMDHIVRCFGWKMNTSVFSESLLSNLTFTNKGKYPSLRPTYEAKDVKGLYFAGAATHGLDYRKSAGGFIHGFRYTARALFRLLEERNFGISWPSTVLHLGEGSSADTEGLLSRLLDRINGASGPYQMFGNLGDVVLFEQGENGLIAKYLEELPLEHARVVYPQTPRLVWFFRYGEGFHGREVLGMNRVGSSDSITAEKSKFLHPQLSFFPAHTSAPSMQHWLFEDIFTSWQDDTIRDPLKRFLSRVVANLTAPFATPVCQADCWSPN